MMDHSLLAPDDDFRHTDQKIIGFKKLQVGWHYGRGIPPTDDAVSKARALNIEALRAGFKKTNAFPGIDGEIQVTAYHQSIYLELTIELDGMITFVYERDDQEIAYEKVTFDEVITKIRKFRGLTWALSGLSTSSTTTPIEGDSEVLPSDLPAMGAAFPSLTQSAYSEPVPAFVSTSEDFTGTSLEFHQFSGTFPLKYLEPAGWSSRQAPPEMSAITTS
jgi:hypothetical protein